MKIIETLSTEQITNLLEGTPTDLFTSLIDVNDVFYNKLYDLCLGYYFGRSASKNISPTYRRLLELKPDSANELIGKIIRGKFVEKWDRIYNALITEQYNPINTIELTETKTGTNSDTKTLNTQKKNQGNNSDTTTYNTSVVDNGNSSTEETTTRNSTINEDYYGFNSVEAVGDTISENEESETLKADKDKNTTHNERIKTGTDSKLFGINETETHTGTDKTDYVINENYRKTGRDGSPSELIEKELNLRNTNLFFDIVYSDIDSIATLQIYI